MDFLCYLHPSWQPRLRPAEATRGWMDATHEAFAYRCLPLNIANAHGWEVLNVCPFEAYWNGGSAPNDVVLRFPRKDQKASGRKMGTRGMAPREVAGREMAGREMDRPVALFGQGTLTFHIQGLFRTPPGWNLWVGGSPNRAKDGIAPLTGVIETDWSPYTFTMNWRFTRRNHWVRFAEDEPVCFLFPVLRDALERMDPKLVPLEKNPDLAAQFAAWSVSRDAFQKEMETRAPVSASDKWQKRYYRGLDMKERAGVADHRAKLRLKPFTRGVPKPQAQVRLDVDADRLAAALGAVVKGLKTGRNPDELAAQLTEAGIPPDVAARVVAKAGV